MLDDALAELGCGGLLVVARSWRDPFLAPFVGRARLGECLLIAPRGREPLLGFFSPLDRVEAATAGLRLLTPGELDVQRWARDDPPPGRFLADVVARALQLAELPPGPLAIAGCAPAGTVHAACALLAEEGWRFAAGERAVLTLRKRKDAASLAEIRRVASVVVEAFRHLAELLAAALLEGGEVWLGGERLRLARLEQEVATLFARRGLEQPEGHLFCAGEEAAVPHTAGDGERPLRPGEAVVVDLFPKERFFADCTRTFCIGGVPEPLAAAHLEVRAALDSVRREARPGARGWDLDQAVCERFGRAGYATHASDPGGACGYVHGLGHGVGHELHEYPSFGARSGAEGVLEEGDVFTLEPGLYDPGAGWAVRLEDLHALGPRAPEILTPLPYDLDPRAWRALSLERTSRQSPP